MRSEGAPGPLPGAPRSAYINFGNGFASASCRRHTAPLLFEGDDFPQTDVVPA